MRQCGPSCAALSIFEYRIYYTKYLIPDAYYADAKPSLSPFEPQKSKCRYRGTLVKFVNNNICILLLLLSVVHIYTALICVSQANIVAILMQRMPGYVYNNTLRERCDERAYILRGIHLPIYRVICPDMYTPLASGDYYTALILAI